MIPSVVQEDTVVFSDFYRRFHGNGGCPVKLGVDLQRIEEKKHISGKEKHAFFETGGNACHADEKFIKERGSSSVRQFSWNR